MSRFRLGLFVAAMLVSVNGVAATDSQGPGIAIRSAAWASTGSHSLPIYSVTVANDSATPFAGEIAIVPRPQPVVTTSSVPVPVAMASSSLYRAPLRVDPGEVSAISIPIPAGTTPYQVEVRDREGRTVAQEQTLAPPKPTPAAIALLTDTPQQRIYLSSGSNAYIGLSPLFTSAHDFPANALMLTGLKAIVIDDFDSASLDTGQTQALKEFVAMGGTLVLAGGEQAARTVLPLPEEITPLRPTGTTMASLGPITDLVAQAEQVAVTVATGPLVEGRILLDGTEQIPLIVDKRYGAGRIVQLAFDPLRELQNRSSDKFVALLARDFALAWAGVGAISPSGGTESAVSRADRAAAILVATQPAFPPLVPVAVGLMAYMLAMGMVGYRILGQPGRHMILWLGASGMALVLTGGLYTMVHGPWKRSVGGAELQIQYQASAGPLKTESWHLVTAPGYDTHLVFPAGAAVGLGPPSLQTQRLADPVEAVTDGSRGDATPHEVVDYDDHTVIKTHDWPLGSVRLLGTSSLERSAPIIEANLRLAGGRVVGTVANRSKSAVRRLIAVTSDGSRAALGTLPPGIGKEVDAAVEDSPSTRLGPGARLGAVIPSELSASRAERRRDSVDEMAMEGVTPSPTELTLIGEVPSRPIVVATGAGYRPSEGPAFLVAVLPIQSSDTLTRGAGASRLVNVDLPERRGEATSGGRPDVFVHDFDLAPGIGEGLALVLEGPQEPWDVYNWSTHSWRPLPLSVSVGEPLVQGEVRDRLVRVRTRANDSRPVLEVRTP